MLHSSGQKRFQKNKCTPQLNKYTIFPFNLFLISKYQVVMLKYSISLFVASPLSANQMSQAHFHLLSNFSDVSVILKIALTSTLKFPVSFITVFPFPPLPHIYSYFIFLFYLPSSSHLSSHPFSDSSPTHPPTHPNIYLSLLSSSSFALEPLLPKKQHFKSQDKLDRDEPEKDRKEKKKEKRNSKHQEIFDKELKATDIPMQPTEAVILSETVRKHTRTYFFFILGNVFEMSLRLVCQCFLVQNICAGA